LPLRVIAVSYNPHHPSQAFRLEDFCRKAVAVADKDKDFRCPVCGAMILREQQRFMITRYGKDSLKRSELEKHVRMNHWKSTCLDQYYYAMVLGDI
jgi:predicted RNA-binding Zn-ribbon protein involved in translation (DUF1610 family)